MPLSAGERLGSYEISSPLGAGGMGEDYRARDTRLTREVAPADPAGVIHVNSTPIAISSDGKSYA
jgi:hypothetical protein